MTKEDAALVMRISGYLAAMSVVRETTPAVYRQLAEYSNNLHDISVRLYVETTGKAGL